jgi:hypothetical protein
MVCLLDLGLGRVNPRAFNVGERAGAKQGQTPLGTFAKVELTFHDSIVVHGDIVEPLIRCTARKIDLVGFSNVEEEHFFHGIAVIIAKTEAAVDSGIVPVIQCRVILPDGKPASV